MEDDPQQGGGRRDNFPGNGGRRRPTGPGRGVGGGLLSMLLPMLLRNPKLLIVVVIIGALMYFFGGCPMGLEDNGGQSQVVNNEGYNLGASMDRQKYEQTGQFEPLADNSKNPLPEKVSLQQFAPSRLNQGRQGSCVGWASAYAARSIMNNRATGGNPDAQPFSPSYLYNQIALRGCQGSYMVEALETLKRGGVAPLRAFPYDESSCSKKPSGQAKQIASNYRIEGYNRFTDSRDPQKVDMLAMKQNLAQGAPVLIGMMVGGTFMRQMEGQEVWMPSSSDYDQRGFGGHAMCVIGYDDYKEGGSFEIMNSWGPQWGKNGIGWVRYKDFQYFTKEAYGLYPEEDASAPRGNVLDVEFGLQDNSTRLPIKLKRVSETVFETQTPIKKGKPFKVEITNSLPCYIYIFGEETDKSSYVLFPYTKKHSPYCGITGTRLFPRDKSMVADDIGTRDKIAVIISKEPLDYNQANQAINSAPGNTYDQKLQNALGGALKSSVNYKQGNVVSFETALGKNEVVGFTIEIDKQ